jgi:hypothetical protein
MARIGKENLSQFCFFVLLCGSSHINSISLAVSWMGLLAKQSSVLMYILAVAMSTLQFVFNVATIVWTFVRVYRNTDFIEKIGTTTVKLLLVNVFMLFVTQVLHILNGTDEINADESFNNRNIAIIYVSISLLNICVLFMAFFAYVSHKIVISNKQETYHEGFEDTLDSTITSIRVMPSIN